MLDSNHKSEATPRFAWVAIGAFGVLVLYMAGLLSSHLREGAAVFDEPSENFMHSVVAFPVKSLGVWATYLVVLALTSQMLFIWLGKTLGHIPRRTIGLILLVLGLSGFLGVVAELSDASSSAAWGGGYGVSLAAFFLILGGPIAFVLSMGLFGFGIFLGRDWFWFEQIRLNLGKAPNEAFGLGMPANTSEEMPTELDSPIPDRELSEDAQAPVIDEMPAVLETVLPIEEDPLYAGDSQWDSPAVVPDLTAVDVSNPLDDPMADPWAAEVAEPTPITGEVSISPDASTASAFDDNETGEVPLLELTSVEAEDSGNELLFADTADPASADETFIIETHPDLLESSDEDATIEESFQGELPFDGEPAILFKSKPQLKDDDPATESAVDESSETPTHEKPADSITEDPAPDKEEEPEPAALEAAESDTEPKAEKAPQSAPAAGKPREGGSDWASWMTEEAPAERTQGIAKPSYPRTAGSTGGRHSNLEPEGMEGYHSAVAVVIDRDQCSVSLLQRELGISFAKAAATVEQMEKDRIVGPYQGSGHREVLLTAEAWHARLR